MVKTLPRRDEVAQEDQWDIESVFATEQEFDATIDRLAEMIPLLVDFRGTLSESGTNLLIALTRRDEAEQLCWRIILYAAMHRDGDQTNQLNQARWDRAWSMHVRLDTATSFYQPELLALAPPTLDDFIRQEPGLARYQHHFDKLGLLRGHVRSSDVEEVLAQATDVASSSSQIHSVLEDADLTFTTILDDHGDTVELNQGNSDVLINSTVRSVRRAAWQGYADGYLRVKNTMAATLIGAIKSDIFFARARHYQSAIEASMHPHNLPRAVFDNLISTVRAHLPLWHRYWEIRRRALGVSVLHPYDMHTPLATDEHSISFHRGAELLLAALAPLGDDYVEVARRGMLEERWVDKYPNIGKGSGAHSTGVPGTRPFLMQNYDNTLLGVSTLAHEMGHSMHSYLTWQTQPAVYSDYSMFVAETASNFNQALLRAHLLASSNDRRFRIAVIEEGMSNFLRYFFIMPILGQFELDMHQRIERGDGVTADSMSATIADLYAEGFGGKIVMDEPRVGITWAQFPHLFSNFYVWQYATGISAANALAAAVLADGAPAAERYLACLKAGDSIYPLDALKLAGVDMTTPEPIEHAFDVLAGLVEQLDQLVGDGPLPWLPQPDC